jgi:multimeric flavodoxin WrbA
MYAIAVNGSPRKGGNTEILLKRVLAPLTTAGWETELVQVGGKDIRGCQACYKCFSRQDGQCAMKKDVFNEVMEKLLRADALIFGSPTYFTDVSAEMKALLDRAGLVALANGRAFKGKIGAAVVAVRRGGATHVYDTINHMFLMNQMIIPGSVYWNMGYGRDKGEVETDAEGLGNMKNLGQTIAWLGKAIKPHLDSFPVLETVSE